MLVNYLLLDSNNIVIEAPLFDTEINNGEVPDFILNRSDVARIITDYRGLVYIGYPWNDATQSIILPESNNNVTFGGTAPVDSVPGGPDVVIE